MESVTFEDKSICSECGGFCCKKSGCDYAPSDFENLQLDYLQKRLEEGHISIVSFQHFKKVKGKLINEPFLYLRERNINRETVDLLSMKTTCSSLLESGCRYTLDKRPKGGVNLIPVKDGPCQPFINPLDIVLEWKNYQKVLHRLVKRITGKSVNEKMSEDVYKLFCDIRDKKTEGVMEAELYDINGMLPMLKDAYPVEHNKAASMSNIANVPLVKSKIRS